MFSRVNEFSSPRMAVIQFLYGWQSFKFSTCRVAWLLTSYMYVCRDLPVQVEAVNAFREFVEQLAEAGHLEAKLQPMLKDLLLHFFEMASLVEAMDVIMSVDAIILHVGDGIQPYAVECCREVQYFSAAHMKACFDWHRNRICSLLQECMACARVSRTEPVLAVPTA